MVCLKLNLIPQPLLPHLPHPPTPSPTFTSSPCPLLPGEKGSKNHLIRILAPLPWERGWGEADLMERGWGEA